MPVFFIDIANYIGVAGVVIILYAYLMLQINRMSHQGVYYSLLNSVGSVFILYSLIFYWNLASFVIEIAWLLISVYGLGKAMYCRRIARSES